MTTQPTIGIVIPCLNERNTLTATVDRAYAAAKLRRPFVVIVDGGSTDGTTAAIEELIDAHTPCVLTASGDGGGPSRGRQLNAGVAALTAHTHVDLLLFLHADTMLPIGWDVDVVRTSQHADSPMLGCFRLGLVPPLSTSLCIMLAVANARAAWLGMPYGDQAYFVRRSEWEQVGGFANVPLMEDVDLLYRYRALRRKTVLTKRTSLRDGIVQWWQAPVDVRATLRSLSPAACVSITSSTVQTSARRWVKKGVWWNTLLNQLCMAAWTMGVPAETIYVWYYGRKP